MTHRMNQQAYKGAKFVKLQPSILRDLFYNIKLEILNTLLVFFHCSGALVQVNICQKLLFLHQLTHNMTTDCSLNYKFNT